MNIYECAKEIGVEPVESIYESETAKNFAWKMKAFSENFYGQYAGKPVSFMEGEYFGRYYSKMRGNAELAAKQTEHTAEFYAEITKDMFLRGGQLAWKIYEETKRFSEAEEDHRGTILMRLLCSMDFKPQHIIPKEVYAGVEEAFGGIYSVMLMEPVSVPENEEELIEFSKVSFDQGFSIIWRFLSTMDVEKDKRRDKINNFSLRRKKKR